MIPLRKCKNCRKYSDISVEICACGTDLSEINVVLVDAEELRSRHPRMVGQIDETLPVYVQTCKNTGGKQLFLADPAKAERMCPFCFKPHLKKPMLYVPPKKEAEEKPASEDLNQREEVKISIPAGTDYLKIGQNISEMLSGSEKMPAAPEIAGEAEEEEEGVSLMDFFGIEAQEEPDQPEAEAPAVRMQASADPKGTMILTAVTYGKHQFKLAPDETASHLLGRSGEQADFLQADRRVSNQHCFVFYRRGGWYVQDNHSANGTFVNYNDIGLNGVSPLISGDILVLGHSQDSMAFRIEVVS